MATTSGRPFVTLARSEKKNPNRYNSLQISTVGSFNIYCVQKYTITCDLLFSAMAACLRDENRGSNQYDIAQCQVAIIFAEMFSE